MFNKHINDKQARCYLNRYPDLINALGKDNLQAAKKHWRQFGRKEKRNKFCMVEMNEE